MTDTYAAGATGAESETPARAEDLRTVSKFDKGNLLRVLKAWFKEDASFSSPWREQAKKDFAFAAGRQWAAEDKEILEDQGRPDIVFNRTLPVLKIVAGIEINSRHEIKYLPRGVEDTAVNEVLTAGSRWMADTCDAEDEQSEAFQFACKCGMGWCLSDDALVRLPNTHFATTRLYSGAVIQIDLENGKQLTGTPNHPVLTDVGWKRLCDLHEGDNLVNSAFLERVQGLPVEQFDKVETRLKDKIDAFRAGREVLRFLTAPDDFYSDGAGSKVHIVYADRSLRDKLLHIAGLQKRQKTGLAGWNLLSLRGIALAAHSLLQRAIHAAVGQPPLNAAHAPSAYISGGGVLPQFISGSPQPDLYRSVGETESGSDLARRKVFREVETGDLVDRDLGRGASMSLANGVPSAHQSRVNAPRRYSEFIADFFDWKPNLEIEARKLLSGDGESAQFVTRVVRRIVKQVSDFPVHDVGTSLGFFVAGDVITSNTEQRLDYEINPKGDYVEDNIDPREMFWDKSARKKNLVDARRMWRLRKMPIDEARDIADGLGLKNPSDQDLDATWAHGFETEDEEESKSYEEKQLREDSSPSEGDRREVTIIEAQWYERECYYLVVDLMDPEARKLEVTEREYPMLKKRAEEVGIQLKALKLKRRVYKRAFIGGVILGEVGPAPLNDRFSWSCITGELDADTGLWFGLITLMRDPQTWANKWLSQVLHIMNSNAKGGVFAEADAFEDTSEAEDTYAQADSITWTAKGSLSGPNPKIVPKPQAQFPAGFMQLLDFAIRAIPDVTGINLELMGLRDINQPGILEAQRKQAAMTILATLFDSLRRFRKIVGRGRLYLMQNFIADGRIIRVTGEAGVRAMPLLKDAVQGEYDVVVDDAPTSPNQKEVTWSIIVQMLPVFKDMITPEVAIVLLKYSPLPSEIVAAMEKLIGQPNPKAEKVEQIQEAAVIAKIERDKAASYKDVTAGQKNQVDAAQGEIGIQTLLATLMRGVPVVPGAPKAKMPALPQGTAIN